jgi:phage gpG-like protein
LEREEEGLKREGEGAGEGGSAVVVEVVVRMTSSTERFTRLACRGRRQKTAYRFVQRGGPRWREKKWPEGGAGLQLDQDAGGLREKRKREAQG